jgi:hypothetical protein
MDSLYDKQKEAHGKWATMVWIGSGIYLFATDPAAHFFSWQAIVFFIVGMFLAAIVFGGAAYVLQRLIAKVFMLVVREPSQGIAGLIGIIGIVLFIVETVFLAAQWCVRLLF